MIALANHTSIPFFDRVPLRAGFALRRACDLVELPHQTAEGVFAMLCSDLKLINVEPPSRAEFNVWYEEVKRDRPNRDPSSTAALAPKTAAAIIGLAENPGADSVTIHPAVKQPFAINCEVAQPAERDSRIKQARAVVTAAHALFSAKIAAGYSPISAEVDDTIVQDALIELFEDGAAGSVMDAGTTPGNRLADLLLAAAGEDIEIEHKLVNCLTLYMQAELCALLVARAATS